MGVANSEVAYRELRRSDLPSFERVLLQGLGPLEAATGLDVAMKAQFQTFRRPGLLGLVRVLQLLRIANVRLLVAVEREQVVGTTVVAFLPHTGYVAGVATDAAARGRGIATALIERAHAWTRKKGKPWVSLEVESNNETAIRLYRRLGYTEAARYAWFVGPTPPSVSMGSTVPVEIKASDKGARDWVTRTLPEPVRQALPPTRGRLTHLESLARSGGSPVKTWKLAPGGGIQGIVRGTYRPKITTGFALPVGIEPSLPEALRSALVAPAIAWQRSLGATRTVLAVPEPAGPWAPVASSFGLTHAVSSILMVRPAPT